MGFTFSDDGRILAVTSAGAVLRWGRGGTGPPNVGQAPPNILVPTAKIRIVKIYAIFVQWRNQHSYQLGHKQ